MPASRRAWVKCRTICAPTTNRRKVGGLKRKKAGKAQGNTLYTLERMSSKHCPYTVSGSFLLILAASFFVGTADAQVNWEHLVIRRPLPGHEYANPSDVLLEIQAAGLFARQEAERWRWELTLNNGASTTLTFNPARPDFAVRVNNVLPGKHQVEVRLINVHDNSTNGKSVWFFVAEPESEQVDVLQRLEERCRLDVPRKRKEFLAWMFEHAIISGVEIRDDEFGGNAMFATQDLEDGHIVGLIPFNLTFSLEGVARSSFPDLFEQLYLDARTPPDLVTALLLLVELQVERSFFAPYLDLLPPPSRMDTVFSWSEAVWKALRFSPQSLQHATNLYDYFNRVYERFFSVVADSPPFLELAQHVPATLFSREKVKWALALVLSRAWSDVGYQRRKGFHRMLPLADIANHRNTKELQAEGLALLQVELHNDVEEVRMVLKGSVRAGEEVFTSYGEYGNQELLAQYGFLTPNNVEHRVLLPTPALASREHRVWQRAEELRGAALEAEAMAVVHEGRVSHSLLQYHRLEVLRPTAPAEAIVAAVVGHELPLPLELRALHRLSWSLRRLREERWALLASCVGEGGLQQCGGEEEEEGRCEAAGGECVASREERERRVLRMVEEMALQELSLLDESLDLVGRMWTAQLDREEDEPAQHAAPEHAAEEDAPRSHGLV